MLFASSRDELIERFQKQAGRSPSPITAMDCNRGNDDEASVMTFGDLMALVEERFQSFLGHTSGDHDVELAMRATELLQYCNGPVPDIEILPQADGKPSLFRVILDPQ